MTPEDLWNLRRVGQPEPLRDGSAAVVPVTDHIEDDELVTRLYLVGSDGTAKPLTATNRSASEPAVSPSGEQVAFLSKPVGDDHAQVHLQRLGGGESEPVADFPLGARAILWLPDETGLIVAAELSRDHPTLEGTAAEYERRQEDAHAEPVVTEDRVYRYWDHWLAGAKLDHLFRLDLTEGHITHLTKGMDRVIALETPAGTFDVAPDGSEIAFTMDVSDPAWDRLGFAIHTMPTAGGALSRITTPEVAQQRRPRYSPDGRHLLYGIQREADYYADHVRLVLYDRSTEEERVLTEAWDRSASGWEFTSDSEIVVAAEDRAHLRLFTLGIAGDEPQPITSGDSNHGPRPAGDVIWHRNESMSAPPDVAITGGGGTRRIGSFNDALLSEFDLGTVEEIETTGADGDPIQMFVIYPPGFDAGRTWPLLHDIHGGPHNADLDQWHWRWNTHAFAAEGYVVASVNFHGSSSWGQDFATSIQGAWGDKTAADIEAATDHLLSLGFIDAERMAIAGGSYGGYLVSWLTTRTDRYACCICHAGVTDLLGQWATDTTYGRERSFGSTPWIDLRAIQRWSPAANTRDVTTPTLVSHGEKDYRVVVTQGLLWYGILKAKGVEARLVYYPDEGHWILRRSNSVHWYAEFLGWLERWIGSGS